MNEIGKQAGTAPQELVALADVHMKALPARNGDGVLIDPRVEVISKGSVIPDGKLTAADIKAMMENGHVAYRDATMPRSAPEPMTPQDDEAV